MGHFWRSLKAWGRSGLWGNWSISDTYTCVFSSEEQTLLQDTRALWFDFGNKSVPQIPYNPYEKQWQKISRSRKLYHGLNFFLKYMSILWATRASQDNATWEWCLGYKVILLLCQNIFQRITLYPRHHSVTAKTYALSKKYVEWKIICIRCWEDLVKSWSHLSQIWIWVVRSWEGFVTVKSDVDRSDSFKVNALMAVRHEQDRDIFPGGAEEKSSWFSAEAGSNRILRLPFYGSRVIYHHNGGFFRKRPKQKAPPEDLANFEVLWEV